MKLFSDYIAEYKTVKSTLKKGPSALLYAKLQQAYDAVRAATNLADDIGSDPELTKALADCSKTISALKVRAAALNQPKQL